MIGAGWAVGYIWPTSILFTSAQEHVQRPGSVLAIARVPPAVPMVGTRRPFPGNDRGTGSITDIQEPDARIDVENAVELIVCRAKDADITRQRGHVLTVR